MYTKENTLSVMKNSVKLYTHHWYIYVENAQQNILLILHLFLFDIKMKWLVERSRKTKGRFICFDASISHFISFSGPQVHVKGKVIPFPFFLMFPIEHLSFFQNFI